MQTGDLRVLGSMRGSIWTRLYSTTITETVDQSATTETDGNALGDIGGNEYRQAQIFQVSATQQISAVEVKRYNDTGGSPTGNWTLRIETVSAGVPTGTLVDANATVDVTPPAVDVSIKGTFAVPFNLTVSTDYALVITCSNQSNDVYWKLCSSTTSSYANGTRCYSSNGGSSWTAGTNDLWFKVYSGGKVTSVTISGLNGDADIEYFMTAKIINGYNGGTSCLLRVNGDTAANYGRQYIEGTGSNVYGARAAIENFFFGYNAALANVTYGTFTLHAKSGLVRTAIIDLLDRSATTTVGAIWFIGQSWNNTADNITSISLTCDQTGGIGIGSIIDLYKRSDPAT